MNDAVAQDTDIGLLVGVDRLAAAHAFREHGVDRARELFHCRVGRAGANVHVNDNRSRARGALAYALSHPAR